MSGGTKQTQKSSSTSNVTGTATAMPQVPEDILELYRQRTAFTKAGLPQFEHLVNAGLTGDTTAIQPYLRSMYAPYAMAEQSAINQMRRQIPRGGAQDMAIAQALQSGAMKKGEMSAQLLQRLLDYYSTIFGGYNPERTIGQTQTQTQQGKQSGTGEAVTKEPFLIKLGDVASIPIG